MGAQKGAWILRGQGLDQAAQRPFQVLAGVAEGLVTAARLEPAVKDSIRAGLGDHQQAACSALPGLAKFFDIKATKELGPEEHGEARSVQALTTLLHSLGGVGQPVLVLLGRLPVGGPADLQSLDQLVASDGRRVAWSVGCRCVSF